MANLLKTGSDWLQAQRHAHMTQDVVYRRGDDEVALKATIGRSTFDLSDSAGNLQSFESRDYLMRVADLVIDGSLTVPRDGDRIIEAGVDESLVYEVLSIGVEPCFRYSDAFRTTFRVHTKLVGREP